MNHAIAFLAAGLIAFAFTEVSFAQASPEPKLYKVGKAEVWAIADSVGERDTNTFSSFTDSKTLKEYMPEGKVPTAIMIFAVKTGKDIILIDTGLGIPSGDRASMLMPALKKIGINPEDVTMVLISHMHPDHIGGLVWNGQKAFPNAKVKIGRVEKDFWTHENSPKQLPSRQSYFEQIKNVISMYGNAISTFEFGDVVAPGITALNARGHTPGHTVFMLESDGQKFLFIADLLHAAALQFPRPDISGMYDMNPKESAQNREKYLELAAKEKIMIGGAHLPFPAVGTVVRDGKGYKYIPD